MPQQTLNTAEDIDNQPIETVIIDRYGIAWQNVRRIDGKSAWYSATRDTGFYFPSNFVDTERVPAIVLHTPTR